MILAVAHVTAGPNWTAIGVVVGAVIAVGGGMVKLLLNRLNDQDAKIEKHGAVINDTRVSVARIEGYLANQNGNRGRGSTPQQLPDLPAPVVVTPDVPLEVKPAD